MTDRVRAPAPREPRRAPVETGQYSASALRTRRGAAHWLRLNRPEVPNGIDQDVLDGLTAGLDAAASDPDVRVVVLAAAGRDFRTGADLRYARSLADAGASGPRSGVPGLGAHTEEVLRKADVAPETVTAVLGAALTGQD